jgi:hypothetical protein
MDAGPSPSRQARRASLLVEMFLLLPIESGF